MPTLKMILIAAIRKWNHSYNMIFSCETIKIVHNFIKFIQIIFHFICPFLLLHLSCKHCISSSYHFILSLFQSQFMFSKCLPSPKKTIAVMWILQNQGCSVPYNVPRPKSALSFTDSIKKDNYLN